MARVTHTGLELYSAYGTHTRQCLSMVCKTEVIQGLTTTAARARLLAMLQ